MLIPRSRGPDQGPEQAGILQIDVREEDQHKMHKEVPAATRATEVVPKPVPREAQTLEEALWDAVEAWTAEGPNEEPLELGEIEESDLQLLLEAVKFGTFRDERTRALAERLVEADDEGVWSALREVLEFEFEAAWSAELRWDMMAELELDADDLDSDQAVDNEIARRLGWHYEEAALRARDAVFEDFLSSRTTSIRPESDQRTRFRKDARPSRSPCRAPRSASR